MRSETNIYTRTAAIIAALGLVIALVYGAMAGNNNYQGGGNGGSPTPIWPTATASPTSTATATATVEVVETPETIPTAIPVVELPGTGAGSTAKEVLQSNHTGWHYVQWCDSGWILWYRYYATVWNHNIHYNESFGNLGRCWF